MADEVVERLRLEGAEKAARDMAALAGQTSAAARAAQDLQQRYQQMQAAMNRASPAAPGGGASGAAYWAAARAASAASWPGGGTAPGAPQSWAAAGLAAANASPMGQQVSAMNAQLNAIIASGQGAGGGGGGGPGGLLGSGNVLGGSSFQRLLRPLFLAHAGIQMFEGGTKALDDIARGEMTAAQAADYMAQKLGESIPIFGGLVKGAKEYVDVLSGLSTAQMANARFAEKQREQLHLTTQAMGIRLHEEAALFQAGQPAEAARTAGMAAALAGRMMEQPGVLESFRPESVVGSEGLPAGEARRREVLAGAGLQAAQEAADRARQDQQRHREMTGIDNLNAQVADAQRQSDTARTELAQAQARMNASPGFFGRVLAGAGTGAGGGISGALGAGAGAGTAGVIDDQKRAVDVENARAKAEEATVKLGAEKKRQLDALNALKEREVTTAEKLAEVERKRNELAKAQEAVQRNTLDLLSAQVEKTKASAEQAGGEGGPEKTLAKIAALDQLKRLGPQSLDEEQAGMLAGDPLLDPILRERRRQRGRALPEQQELERKAAEQQAELIPDQNSPFRQQLQQGLDAGGDILANLERQRNELRDRVNTLAVENEKTFQDALEKVFGESFKRLAQIMRQAFQDQIDELAVDLEVKRLGQQGQGRERGR